MPQFIGASSGTTSATLPAGWQAGDLAVVFAYRDGNNTAPALPSGWTNIVTGGANTNSSRSGWRELVSGDANTGTWTSATTVICLVYRPDAGEVLGIGGGTRGTGAVASVTYPALTLTRANGTSWGIRFAGHRSVNTTLETPPAGYTLRNNTLDATDEAAAFDTAGGISANPGATAVAVGGTASGWEAHTIELTSITFVSASVDGAWSVRSYADASQAGAWSVRNTASGSASGAWSVQSAALQTATGSTSGAWRVRRYQSGPTAGPVLIDGQPVEVDGLPLWAADEGAAWGAWSVEQSSTTATGTTTGAWSVRSYASASAAGGWSVLNLASGARAGAWSVRNAATGARSGAWSVRAYAAGATAGAWSVQGFGTASATVAGGWSVRAYASAAQPGAWSVRIYAAGSRAGAWAVRGYAGAVAPGGWSVRNVAGQSAPGAWSVRAYATGTAPGAWSVQGFGVASATVSGGWRVRNFAAGATSGAWSVLAPMGIASGSTTGAWSVRGFASTTTTGGWQVRNLASGAAVGAWAVRTAAQAAVAGAWTVRAPAGSSISGAWAVRQYIGASAPGAWSVFNTATATVGGGWSVEVDPSLITWPTGPAKASAAQVPAARTLAIVQPVDRAEVPRALTRAIVPTHGDDMQPITTFELHPADREIFEVDFGRLYLASNGDTASTLDAVTADPGISITPQVAPGGALTGGVVRFTASDPAGPGPYDVAVRVNTAAGRGKTGVVSIAILS